MTHGSYTEKPLAGGEGGKAFRSLITIFYKASFFTPAESRAASIGFIFQKKKLYRAQKAVFLSTCLWPSAKTVAQICSFNMPRKGLKTTMRCYSTPDDITMGLFKELFVNSIQKKGQKISLFSDKVISLKAPPPLSDEVSGWTACRGVG